MSALYRDAFGDPAYLDGALGRLETGQPLRAVDLQELSYAIGREAALKLARTVDADRAKHARQPSSGRRGVWGWLFGPTPTGGAELSPSVVRLIAQVRAGQSLAQLSTTDAARVLGRAGSRAVARKVQRSSRAGVRAVTRAQARNATRRAGRGWGR